MKKINFEIIREDNLLIPSALEFIRGGDVAIIQCQSNECGSHSGECNVNKCKIHIGFCVNNNCETHCQTYKIGCLEVNCSSNLIAQ